MRKNLIIVFLCLLPFLMQSQNELKYLFTAHTYMGESIIDSRLVELNKDVYDNIWLGGDICSETLMLQSNLEYLQTHLKIRDAHNYFSFGNHDSRNGNLEWFIQYAEKMNYYADYNNGMTCIVLDTNLDPSDCENLDNQYNMICDVTDTISESSHLVLLFHWGLWTDVPGLPQPNIYSHSNLKYWNSNCDSTNNNFTSLIYPKLVEVQNRGVDVICIMGDMGATYKKVEFTSDDNITFLGCGLYNIKYRWEDEQWWNKEKDVILELNHNISDRNLTWSFQDIDSLLDIQNGYKYIEKLHFDDYENYLSENMQHIAFANYMYKFNAINDSLIVVDINSAAINANNNELVMTGVYESSLETSADQIEIVCQLLTSGVIVEEQVRIISEIPTSRKYYEHIISFENTIESTDQLLIYIKSIDDSQVLLNNIMVKYISDTK